MVAIYARVSTSEQNPEAQLLALREYAARRDFCIYKEYVDHNRENDSDENTPDGLIFY